MGTYLNEGKIGKFILCVLLLVHELVLSVVGFVVLVGLGRATFFMVRVGFRACSFSPGWARATGNLHGLISGRNILNSGRIRAAFGPHSGHIWATIMYK